ncbi:MAG TPA: MarC family protein [Deltaproteobacteria bacterium]|jgi:multiple antibiotic resistance protein|nr:MarC family protein [Deltaproteobacteria bacterium]HOI05526.1 MarC family protein [Deltaproteobacteria bacterium]
MDEPVHLFISIWIKLFFLLTPFFVLTMFLSLTREATQAERRKVALWLTFDIVVISFVLYFLGNTIFSVFGITLDAFRVGAGALLFLSAVDLVRGSETAAYKGSEGSITMVPLAIPITVGPATTGALLVMGAEVSSAWERLIGCAALLGAVLCVGVLLYLATPIERLIGHTGLRTLSKLTGLVLSALAAQIIFTGVRNFMA